MFGLLGCLWFGGLNCNLCGGLYPNRLSILCGMRILSIELFLELNIRCIVVVLSRIVKECC